MISFVLSISGPFRQSWPNSSSRLDADERKPIVQGTQSSHQVPVGAELRLCKFPPPSLVRRLLGKFCHAAGNNLWHVSPLPQYENFGKLFPLLLGTTNCFLGTFYATKVISTIFGDGLQIASWELFMQQKLFPLFWGTTNCFLGTFYATKVISIVFGNYKLLLENFLCNKSCLCVWHISSCNEKLWLAFLLFWGLRNGS